MSCIRKCIADHPQDVEDILSAGAKYIRDEAAKLGVTVSPELETKIFKFAVKQGLIAPTPLDA